MYNSDAIPRTDKEDGHWTPGYMFCNICLHKFDYIIKLEEEPLELWYLVDKIGLWEDREVFLNKANSSNKKLSEKELLQNTLDGLSNSHRAWVNEKFRGDFELFGYEELPMQGS